MLAQRNWLFVVFGWGKGNKINLQLTTILSTTITLVMHLGARGRSLSNVNCIDNLG